MLTKLFAVFICAFMVNSDPSDDLVTNLPGITWPINFKQYSGFLRLQNGHNLHYWFMESQNNPATDPVTLWFVLYIFEYLCVK